MTRQLHGFVGFPDQDMLAVVVPDLFFVDLLPQIDDLAELKLTVYFFWLLNEQDGPLRFVRGDDLRCDETLLNGLGLESDLRSPLDVLNDALERAVARNTLIRMEVDTGPPSEGKNSGGRGVQRKGGTSSADGQPPVEDWYFLNTAKGRQSVAAIRQGRLAELRGVVPEEARLHVERPNVFVLYEQNFGLMTAMIADQLRDMEKSYPPDWIIEAMEISLLNNKRHLNYIRGILRRWETEGKDEGYG
ncbi:MAG: DnaD domain protein [Caldilineaceae bacterium SB0675_bin_29]|uniref:DnaD domain protein n=1 Tax=Caldilineaceae bacterium SB0675_bin_29 TaxID=2605266 RepID=A0A6B1G3K3_9CHLR|nr:DnaD domain protein [Caldilineaceae bacterium SB0675_bin_29]